MTFKNSSAEIWGAGASSYGVWLQDNTYVRVKGLEITVSSRGTRNHGPHFVSNINTRYVGLNASANDGSQRAAALFVSNANPDIDASFFSGTGAIHFNYAAYISNGFFTLTDSTLSSNTRDWNNRAAYHTSNSRTRS